jgi:predicted AlkP superfamily phosphohydrolase/phosphomutase
MVASPARILFLGVDAASAPLVEQWARAGVLPAFQALLARGLAGETRSLAGFFVGSTWPSFATGVTPARHGFHSLVQLRPGTYELYRRATGDPVGREPFWVHLSRAGRRVAILDVPLSGPAQGLNGIQIVEWGSHDAAYGFRTWPRSLAPSIRLRFGAHPLGESCDADHRTPEEYRMLAARLVEGVRRKTALTRRLLGRERWDFFAQVFTESHCVGHQGWHLHDARHPAHDPRVTAVTGDPVREVYVAIDAAVGELVRRAGPDCLTVVLLSHGMSHRYGAQFLLRDILIRLGVAVPPPAAEPGRPGATRRLDTALGWGWRHTPRLAKRGLEPLRGRVRGWLDEQAAPTLSLDPLRSRCFLVHNGLAVGGIRLNLAGREPRGIVVPGAEEGVLARQLAIDLEAIVDLDTGRPIVRQVLRTADLYRGEYLGHLPDLLVAWSDERPVGSATVGQGAGATLRLGSGAIGTVEGANRYCRTGDHRPEGLFVAVGPGVRPGRLAGAVSVMDFAPTFARLLDAELPDVDGRPIPELLAAGLPRGRSDAAR